MAWKKEKARTNTIIQKTILLLLISIGYMFGMLNGLCYNDINACKYIEYSEGYGGKILDAGGYEYLSLDYYPPPTKEYELVNNIINIGYYVGLLGIILYGVLKREKIKEVISKYSK